MSSDEIKMFSEKYKVSEEEAKKTIEKIRNKKENEEKVNKDKKQPVLETGDPMTEFSKKIMGINQAAISTAETQRFLKAHPDDVEDLKGQIGAVKGSIGELYDGLGKWQTGIEGEIKNITKILEGKDQKETRDALIKEVTTSIEPLKKDLETVKTQLAGNGEPKGPAQVFEKAKTVTDQAKGLLESAGYKVISGHVSREEIEKMIAEAGKRTLEEIPTEKLKEKLEEKGFKVEAVKLSREEVEKMIEERSKKAMDEAEPEELRKRLEAAGYKVAGGPLTRAEVDELVKKAKHEAQEEVLDDKRIDAIADIIKDSIQGIIEMFKPAVNIYTEYMFSGKGGQPSKEQSVSQEKSA